MHHMCYVLVPVSEAKSSLEARQFVYDTLSDDATFVSEGGRFVSPVCDCFYIGGRWSGVLYPQKLSNEFWTQVKHLQQPNDDFGIRYSFIQEYRKQLDAIWTKLGGKYASPLTRSPHSVLGEEDDAIILESWLADDLNVYLSSIDKYDIAGCYIHPSGWALQPIVISLDDDLLDDLKDFNSVIGKYWVVLIDCHNI